MNKVKKISIIIPCYNCEKWIKRTLDALINQTEKVFEVIFIDDGSSDNGYKIANKILEKSDLKYKVISQKNSGVSIARNKGIDISSGEYIYFLDADDYIDEHFCEVLCNKIEKNNEDIIFFSYYLYEDNNLKEFNNETYDYDVNIDVINKILNSKIKYNMCSLIIKKEIIMKNGIYFTPKCKYGEDHEFIIKCVVNSSTIGVINEKLFYYIRRKDSAVAKFTKERLSSIDSAKRIEIYLNERIKDFNIYNSCKKYIATKLIYNLDQFVKITNGGIKDRELKKTLIKVIKENKDYCKFLNYNDKSFIKKIKAKILENPKLYINVKTIVTKIKNN